MKLKLRNTLILLFVAISAVLIGCAEDEITYDRTRLFKPSLAGGTLRVDANSIIVNLSKEVGTVKYKIEISRDTFNTLDYFVEVDTNYIVIDENLVGEELLWFTIYQVRATAFADETQYDSRPSDLGSTRTEKFPSNLITPQQNDLLDTKVKVEWVNAGDPINKLGIFAATDARLSRPLRFVNVSDEESVLGEVIVTGLNELTTYQIAIYSGDYELRGWERYTTVKSIYNLNGPKTRNLTENTDPDAVANLYSVINDGDTLVLKKGAQYNLPPSEVPADKSVTIIGAIDFADSLARIYTTGNWNVLAGASIDHIRFVNLEIRGEDWTGDYVMNIDASSTINEFVFQDCHINHFRGLMRMKDAAVVSMGTFKIDNCIVNQIGGYGILTVDNKTSTVNDIVITNSTFVNVEMGITSYLDIGTITMDGVTANNFPRYGRWLFRLREDAEGKIAQVTGGVSVSNCIFGRAWDQSSEDWSFSPLQGGDATGFTFSNVYGTSELIISTELSGFPSSVYSGGTEDLWVFPNPDDGEEFDFNFSDGTFSGRTNTGDPRWRAEF
ncbi:MAG: hypothetical protein ACJA08_001982 [Cyclobacteriaceae bacterium]|jgi:hypothetical protein